MDTEQLKAWTCARCGAPLPKLEDDVLSVQCASCGTAFRVPQANMRASGIQISGGNIVIHGDVVGGDLIVGGKSKAQMLKDALSAIEDQKSNVAPAEE